MSNLGKICCAVAIVGSLLAAVFGFLTAKERTGYFERLEKSVVATKGFPNLASFNPDVKIATDEPAATLTKAAVAAKKTLEERNQLETTLTETKSTLAETDSKLQKMTTDYTATKKDLDEKSEALTKASADLQVASAELKDLKDKLGGRSIDEMVKDLSEAVENFKVVAAEKKIVDDALAKASAELTQARELLEHKRGGTAPLDMSGRVAAIDKQWNFVVLDVGKSDKLMDGVELTVYRGTQLVGKIRTVEVQDKSAIADIIPDLTPIEIQVGDKVLY